MKRADCSTHMPLLRSLRLSVRVLTIDMALLRSFTQLARTTALNLAFLFAMLTTAALGAAERCAICGKELPDKFYTMTDRVTDEKKHVCPTCADLPNDCFLCGLP